MGPLVMYWAHSVINGFKIELGPNIELGPFSDGPNALLKGPSLYLFGNQVNNLANDLYYDGPLIDTGPIR